MTAYQTAQTIALAIVTAVGIWGSKEFFLIGIIAMLITAGLHELTGD
jgi:hypothetical protein